MNSMGPNNKLTAMMMGLGVDPPGQGPQTSGPTPAQPRGMQQPHDPAAPGFQTMKKGLNGLADMLLMLGDQVSSTQVAEMAIELSKISETRNSDLLKKLELDQKYGQADAMINTSGAAAQGNY